MSSTDVSDCVDNVNSIETGVAKNRRVGRPPKQAIAAAKKKNKVGRPAGEAAIINEMKARLIASPKSKKVLDSIMNAALDDEHKNQAAAWKLLMDRMLPVSMFEKEKNGGARPSVNITISGVGGNTTITDGMEDIDDADYEVVEDDSNV
jgi:hypothetical protein